MGLIRETSIHGFGKIMSLKFSPTAGGTFNFGTWKLSVGSGSSVALPYCRGHFNFSDKHSPEQCGSVQFPGSLLSFMALIEFAFFLKP